MLSGLCENWDVFRIWEIFYLFIWLPVDLCYEGFLYFLFDSYDHFVLAKTISCGSHIESGWLHKSLSQSSSVINTFSASVEYIKMTTKLVLNLFFIINLKYCICTFIQKLYSLKDAENTLSKQGTMGAASCCGNWSFSAEAETGWKKTSAAKSKYKFIESSRALRKGWGRGYSVNINQIVAHQVGIIRFLFLCYSFEHTQASSDGSCRHQLPHEGLERHGGLGPQLWGQSQYPQEHPVHRQARWVHGPGADGSVFYNLNLKLNLNRSTICLWDKMICMCLVGRKLQRQKRWHQEHELIYKTVLFPLICRTKHPAQTDTCRDICI